MKFIGLPEREANEEPATDRQIRYLLDLVPWLKERDIRKLGILQASYMIDHALLDRDKADSSEDEDEDEDEDFDSPRMSEPSQQAKVRHKKSVGCVGYMVMFILIILLLGFITKIFAEWM